MALLQALISMVGKSASKILTAIFGWAVVALFGRSSPKEHTLLSGLVGLAAAWPVLLVGIAVPRIAAFVIAFVPLSDRVPDSIFRIVWLALAVLVPLIVGTVVAAKAPPGTPREGFIKRTLRGFPITIGISAAFLLMFITVPALRLMSAVRGRKDDHVPCITDDDAYDHIARRIDSILERNAIEAKRTEPSWWLSGPANVLRKLGGKALRGFMPDHLAYWLGPELEIAFYPSDILVRGKNDLAARIHGLLAEALAHEPCRQTFDPNAQDLERQIRQVWRVYDENPKAHVRAAGLLSRVVDITKELSTLKVDYDEWQVIYRQTLQLSRALQGQPQILEVAVSIPEAEMHESETPTNDAQPLAALSTGELLTQLTKHSAELVKKQVELAQSELRADMKQEIKALMGVGLAGACVFATFNLLLVAAVFAIAEELPGWQAALIVAAVVLALGALFGLVGWAKRVKAPLDATQKTLKEDAQWAKERLT
jgi:uncharacterized membrane protein YqjE